MKFAWIIMPVSLFCSSCTRDYIQPFESFQPITAINPPEEIPLALAWHGKTPLTMGVDTGATQATILFSPSAEKFGARIRGRKNIRTARLDLSFSKDDENPIRQHDVVMTEYAPYDGLIGWESIRKYVWNINYPKAHHAFYTSLPKQVSTWGHMSLDPKSDFAQVLDAKGRRIIIDTGAPYALYFSKSRWQALKHDYPDATVSIYSGFSPAAGGYYALECMRIKSYKINNLSLKDITVCESFADSKAMNIEGDIDILIGAEAFHDRNVWIDGPNNTLYFSYNRQKKPFRALFNCVGAAFIPTKEKSRHLQAKVVPWSFAWDSGLRTDDILVSINGQKSPTDAMIDYVTCQPGASATIVVRRKREELQISWVVPSAPSPGEYHPTPEAVTEEAFQQHLSEEERKNNQPPAPEQTQPAAPADTNPAQP